MAKEKEKGKGKKLSKREMVDRFQENCDRIGEIADLCEKEERERTEAEEAEIQAIIRENEIIRMKMQAMQVESLRGRETPAPSNDQVLRETLLECGQKVIVMIMREEGSTGSDGCI